MLKLASISGLDIGLALVCCALLPSKATYRCEGSQGTLLGSATEPVPVPMKEVRMRLAEGAEHWGTSRK